MKNYEPRCCIICGKEYVPIRMDQRTCASPECKKARQRINYHEYRKKNYAAVLETNRRSMAKRRKEREQEKNPPKKDTIVAIGYADRQRAATLRLVGRVNTEL
jgi:hypothetical protein